MIGTNRLKEHLTEALQNNKEEYFETELCRYANGKLEKLKVTLSLESCKAKL